MTERTAHHQRRPPDVHEALSSMLWTPYERTPTDSSSEDDDERLNKKLRKSHSSYDYRSVPAFEPTLTSSYFGADDFQPTTTAMTPAPAPAPPSGGFADSPALPPTPFVPFSNLIFSSNNNGSNGSNLDTHTVTTANHNTNVPNYHKNFDSTASSFRFSYPYYGPLPSLNKWWSSTSTAQEPPSYESLYAKGTTGDSSNARKPPVLNSLKVSVSTTSQRSCDNATSALANGQGRLVHSFTDDFISEDCGPSELSPRSSNAHIAQQHVARHLDKRNLTQANCNSNDITVKCPQQQQQVENVRHHLTRHTAANAEKVHKTNTRSQQNKENIINNNNNNNNSSSSSECTISDQISNQVKQQQKELRPVQAHQQPCACAKEVEQDEQEEEANTEQVNQPSVDQCATNTYCATAMNSRTRSKPWKATTMKPPPSTKEEMANPTISTTMNSTNTMSASDKATKWNSNTPTEPSECGATLVHALDTRPAVISLASSFEECAALSSSSSSSSLSCTPNSSPSPPLFRKSRKNFESLHRSSASNHRNSLASSSALTPNKCLAELERLYAEFRASESIAERNDPLRSSTVNMRVNIPAAVTVAADATTVVSESSHRLNDSQAFKVTPPTTTSSVFLTTTNSVTTNSSVSAGANSNNCSNNTNTNNNNNNSSVAILSTNPCQRQPSLTIQVNNNSIANNNNNNNVVASPKLEQCLDVMLNQSIVNSNGVSVVNCNYVGVSNTSNNNNNNHVSPQSVGVPNTSTSVNVNSSSPVPNAFSNKVKSSTGNINNVAANILNNNNVVATAATACEASVNIINVNTQTETTTTVATPSSQTRIDGNVTTSASSTPSRTYTSTECQTDDISSVQLRSDLSPSGPPISSTREQRRRERRERRHHHQQLQQSNSSNALMPPPMAHRRHLERHSLPAHAMPHLHPPHMHHVLSATATMPAAMSAMLRPMLPDILHSHFPPPYSALNGGNAGGGGGPPPLPPPPMVAPPPPPPPAGTTMLTSVISTVPIPGAAQIVGDGRFTLPLPIIRRSPSERSGKGCCGQWFAGPPLRALIAVVALGGVACALGGAALGATGLAGPPSSHLTAALLMIGVGVVLVTVSGAAWRMTAPGGPPCLGLGSSVDLGRCGRRPCSRGGGAPHGLLYPEFQHRPPPPSYQASMQEYRLRLLLLDRDRQNGVVRGNSPPPTYRSHAGSLLRAPLTTTIRGGGGGSSSIGGSEYSLPPSYRSRNTTPATICSDRSIETASSGRLLANEDIPEPLSAEQLPGYSSLQLHQRSSDPSTPKITNQLRTSAIVEIEASHNDRNEEDSVNEKLTPRVFSSKEANNFSGKDLVTIVTISQGDSQVSSGSSGDQIEILAHL